MNDSHEHDRPGAERSVSDDQLESLLLLAGRRPEVPAHDAAIVEAAARAEWRRVVGVRRRRTFYVQTGGLLAAAAVLLLVLNPALVKRVISRAPVPTIATVLASSGLVETGSGVDLAEVGLGEELVAGAMVETAGGTVTPGRAALRLADGTSLRLDVDTRLRLVSASVLLLERGAVYVDTGKPSTAGEPAAPTLEVQTAAGVARDYGTQFEVRYRPGDEVVMRVRVREGKVVLERAGKQRTAGAGVALEVLADGTLIEREIELSGESWDWVIQTLPPFDVDGRSLREFLDWTRREAHWQLRYADPALADQAAEIELHGSISGLTLEQAVAAVLAGSGLGYRLENDTLVIQTRSP